MPLRSGRLPARVVSCPSSARRFESSANSFSAVDQAEYASQRYCSGSSRGLVHSRLAPAEVMARSAPKHHFREQRALAAD